MNFISRKKPSHVFAAGEVETICPKAALSIWSMVNFRLHVFTRRRDRRGISCRIINFHGAAKICPTKRTNCTKPCNLFCGKSTALNGTAKKCRFNQFLSNVCTLHSQSCEVEKKHTFTEVLTDKVFVRQYQTALPLVSLY